MYVFELYARRLAKRKVLLSSMLLLPVLLAFVLAKAYEPNQVDEFTAMMSSMFSILIILTLLSSMLFYRDKQHQTTQRIFLSTQSKFSFYCQKVLVFLAVSMLQLGAMVIAMEGLIPSGLSLAFVDYVILVFAYCLLSIITTGIGLLVMNRSHFNFGGIRITTIALIILLLYGVICASIELPAMFQTIAYLVPSYWLTEVVAIVFDNVSLHVYKLFSYMVSFLVSACLILWLLVRTKTEKI